MALKRGKLSVLIFSRNDIAEALGLIKSLYKAADEIVVMDSSDRKQHVALIAAKKAEGLAKLKILPIFAIGYPDPLRMYALQKCSNEWVLLMDTDERLSEKLVQDLNSIISSADASAFAIRRYEEMKEGKFTDFFTWQVRLMKRDKITYRGLRHEQPIIKGSLKRLESGDYYMEHRKAPNPAREWGYNKLEKLDTRLSYRMYNANMLGFLAKMTASSEREFDRSKAKKALEALLLGYEKLTLRGQADEISNFDYFFYHFYVTLGYSIKRGDAVSALQSGVSAWGRAKQVAAWRREPDSKELFEISKLINELGVTRFLELDREATIRTIYNRYKGKSQGIDLLITLLKDKYDRGYKS